MERTTTNEASSGRDRANLSFRDQTPEDADHERGDATLQFEGRIRLSCEDELKCDPYNRVGRLTRGNR